MWAWPSQSSTCSCLPSSTSWCWQRPSRYVGACQGSAQHSAAQRTRLQLVWPPWLLTIAACLRRVLLPQIVLLGVCISPSPAGGDLYEQLSLQPMPLYSLPSDNVVMTCFASSAGGRLFMGGSDGNLYEIQYEATDTWRRRRCSKVREGGAVVGGICRQRRCRPDSGEHARTITVASVGSLQLVWWQAGCRRPQHFIITSARGVCCCLPLQVRITGGIQQLLPSFLPGLLFGPPVPLERLVLDDERGILYSLAANNALQVTSGAC